ncbi:oxygen-independent coproporphyrinogen III oxidase [Pinisolibacter aquiterrae]|uniref:oxygen-independent coproporphyrinogen III oxidase n=1 Tax=Pinisolibacter aquiterrae TaxID=2815579 RepID=UPI001C3C7828|nr:oxygen-independent coproporphyrinogen III oxidase [Pinisolibacter aquiterrae]MBV5266760.1 oxygen-independent coproporphyrinogen III oxidase [Pinisolibacter aquiterrae]MCC8234927.1 oxygen-independent coproporphyrinogen III oxidase [Pinisolibacter aquiterrae]
MTNTIELKYATRSVPRYTSYPTAPHFGDGVDGALYASWLAGLGDEAPVSLYLHVPYCRAICHYCGCHTKAALKDDPVIDYARGLVAEIALVRAAIGRRLRVGHIHWGGGTPSLLPIPSFRAVVAALREAFEILPTAEHAMELDPRTVTPELAQALAEAGITRASLGVQDFDEAVQVAIGRIQPIDTVTSAVEALRGAGIAAINFDLMYGLPHQTAATIRRTIELAHGFSPSRIALFGYAHVPWFKKHQRLIDEAALPGATERIALERTARAALADYGYEPIGLDHFALPHDDMAIAAKAGDLHRNFQGYTTDTCDTLIGFGASSIGQTAFGFVQNDPDIGRWRRAIEKGNLPIAKGKAVDDDDRLRAAIIERIMCDYAVDLDAVCAAHGVTTDAVADAFERLEEPARDGLVAIDGHRLTVSEAGKPLVRIVAAAFDVYLARAAARHSVAV